MKKTGGSAPATVDKAHHIVGALEITDGFLKGARLEFADSLNCIIGGRGTGKTTVLEFIRYALGVVPDEKAAPARAKAVKAVVQSNLGAGRIPARRAHQARRGLRRGAALERQHAGAE